MISRVEMLTVLSILLISSNKSLAFAPRHVGTHQQSHQCSRTARLQHSTFPSCRQHSILYSTPSEDEDAAAPTESITTTITTTEPEAAAEPQGTQYPINLPSPLLLASGMILAIVCTGSTFQLASGTPPPLGVPATFGIVFVGIPACFYFLYAAILKGIAETEEDDKKFLSEK